MLLGFTPTPLPGSSKYGATGGCTASLLDELGPPDEITESITKWGNLGVAKSTWSSYKTAQFMLEKCQSDTGISMALPLSHKKTLVYIDWLARTRKLKGATIKTYLAGVRQMHVVRGLEPPELRTGLVRLVLKGIENADGISTREKGLVGRLPMTKNAMLLFKQLIRNSLYTDQDKMLFWAVATLAFAGAFRIHEILSRTEATFDPSFTLLKEDVTTSQTEGQVVIHIKLKCPKESRSAAPTIVDIFQNNSQLCPVKAFLKWTKLAKPVDRFPLFRLKNGTPFTGAKMNRIMTELLGPHTDKKIGFFATHSFRIGIASMLGQAGFEDQDIMASGRWSSRVFERYLKLAWTKRQQIQTRLSKT